MISFLSKYLPNVVQLGWGGDAGWGTSIFQTLFMTFWSANLWWHSWYYLWRDFSFN